MKREEYLQILVEQIRCKKARGAVCEEIQGHIEDQKRAFMSEGMNSVEAEEAAVHEMGDPIEAGNELDRIHRPKMAWGMIGLIVVLSVAGFLVQYFLKMQMGDSGILASELGYNLGCMILGLCLMIAVCYADYSRIGYWAKELIALIVVVMVIDVMVYGAMLNGSHHFIIPILNKGISIAQLFFFFIPLYAGVLYSFRGQGRRAIVKSVGLMAFLVYASTRIPNPMTTVILLVTFLVTLSIAVYKNWFKVSRKITLIIMWAVAALLPVIAYFGVMVYGADYQRARLQGMVGTSQDGVNYQMEIIRELLSGSQIWGYDSSNTGLGKAMPDSGSYVLTYVAAYWGVLAAALLVILIVFLFLRLLKVSIGQKNQLGMLMGASCSIVFLVQQGLYLLGNMGLLPVGGFFSPFITSGGTGMLVTYILLGLILSIYRYQNVIPQKSTAEGRKRLKRGKTSIQ